MLDAPSTFYVDGRPQPGDENLNPVFEYRQVYDQKASEGWQEQRYNPDKGVLEIIDHPGEGRAVYKTVEYVTIYSGDRDNIPCRPVQYNKKNPSDPRNDCVRFARQYDRFKKGMAQVPDGIPLQALAFQVPPILSEADVAGMKHDGIHTVEALADLPDALGQRYRGFPQLKEKVRNYLAAAKADAPQAQARVEADRRDAEVAQLRKALSDQGALIAKLLAEKGDEILPTPPKRVGRPPKSQAAAEGA